MLDDYDGISVVNESVQYFNELVHVGRVKPRGRLVEDIDGFTCRTARELGRKLDALSLAARERCRGLTYLDISESDVIERLKLALYLRYARENSSPSSTVISSTS